MAAYAPPQAGEVKHTPPQFSVLRPEQIPSAAVAILYSCLNMAATRLFGLRFSR